MACSGYPSQWDVSFKNETEKLLKYGGQKAPRGRRKAAPGPSRSTKSAAARAMPSASSPATASQTSHGGFINFAVTPTPTTRNVRAGSSSTDSDPGSWSTTTSEGLSPVDVAPMQSSQLILSSAASLDINMDDDDDAVEINREFNREIFFAESPGLPDDNARTFMFNMFVNPSKAERSFRGFFEILPGVLPNVESMHCLQQTTTALSFAMLAGWTKDPAHSYRASEYHGRALSGLRAELSKGSTWTSDETLLTILMLQMYQVRASEINRLEQCSRVNCRMSRSFGSKILPNHDRIRAGQSRLSSNAIPSRSTIPSQGIFWPMFNSRL